MNDSVDNWIKNGLGYYKHLGKTKNYQIDSLICYNADKSKLITVILQQQLLDTGVQDDIEYLYGVKIDNEWYFFSGGTLVLPRHYYQKNVRKPLTFDKMKDLAIKHIYGGYLKKGVEGTWEVNDKFFRDLTSGAWCNNCSTQAQWDSVYLSVVRSNWANRD